MTSPLLFENYWLPAEYHLTYDLLDSSKPNFKADISIPLVKNPNHSSKPDDNLSFSLTLNTSSLVSLSANLVFSNDPNSKQTLEILNDRENNTTTYKSKSDVDFSNSSPSINISYIGKVKTILNYDDLTLGLFKTTYMNPLTGKNDLQIFSTHTQPHYAMNLLPCIDEISFKIPVKLTINIKDNFECVSNTPIESIVKNTTSKTVTFESTPPISLSVFAFTFGDLECIEHTKAKVPLRVFTQIGESHRSRFALNTAIKTLNALLDKFQLDYPLPKLDFVSLPFLSDGGVENWSCISIINDGILAPNYQISKSNLVKIENQIEDIVVHQFVHMFMGDLVTIDNWDYEWFNESFATFMSNELLNRWQKLSTEELQQLKLTQMDNFSDLTPIQAHSNNFKIERINETFTRSSYEKGIWVLKLVVSLFQSSDDFFKAVGQFISLNKFGTFKPIDLWNFLKTNEYNKFKYDIPTIVHSWTHLKGIPIIQVSNEGDDSIKLEQRQCLFENIDDNLLENVPFQIPLLLKSKSGKLVRHLMTDRSLLVKNEDFLSVKFDLSIVNYSLDHYIEISENFKALNDIEQCQVIQDLNILLSSQYQNDDHLIAVIAIIKNIKNISKLNPWAMESLLTNIIQLSKLNPAKFDKLTMELTNKFIQQFQWETNIDDLEKLNPSELNVRSTILSLNLNSSQLQQMTKRLFKKLVHGPRNTIPKEFLVPLLSSVAHNGTIKEFKEIANIVKHPDSVINNTFTISTVSQLATKNDIQLSALNSLGCFQDDELIQKTFTFINSNVELPMIEMSLMSMTCYSEILRWWISNENKWYLKWKANHLSNIGKFFENVCKYLFDLSQRVGGQFQTDIENWSLKKSNSADKRIQYWLLESKEKPKEISLKLEENVLNTL